LPRQDHIYKTTDESFRLHNKTFDEIRCKLDSTENPRLFEKYPTPPLTLIFIRNNCGSPDTILVRKYFSKLVSWNRQKFHCLVHPLCGTSWDKWNWDKLHRGYREFVPGQGKASSVGI